MSNVKRRALDSSRAGPGGAQAGVVAAGRADDDVEHGYSGSALGECLGNHGLRGSRVPRRRLAALDGAPVSRLATVVGLWNFASTKDWTTS